MTAGPNEVQAGAVDKLINSRFNGFNGVLNGNLTSMGQSAEKIAGQGTSLAIPTSGLAGKAMGSAEGILANAGKTERFADDLASGKWLTPESNPYLKQNVETAMGQATDAWNRSINPTLQDAAIRGGAYGGSRNGIATGLAASEVDRNMKEVSGQLYGQHYTNERQNMMQAPSIYGQATGMRQAYGDELRGIQGMQALEQDNVRQNASALAGLSGQTNSIIDQINKTNMQQISAEASAGQQMQAWQQAFNDEDYLRYQIEQAAPWAGIPEMLSVLTGGGFQSTSATGPNPNYRSGGQQLMGLGSLGLGILGMPWTGGASLGATLFS